MTLDESGCLWMILDDTGWPWSHFNPKPLDGVAAAIKALLGACCAAASFREDDIANAQPCRLV
jgi:hypothetical protein